MNSDVKIVALVKLVRPLNFVIIFFTVIVAAVICAKGGFSITKIILTAISASLTASGGNVLNDVIDVESDKINHPFRPLPTGLLSIKSAMIFYFLVSLISLVMSYYVSLTHLMINAGAVILLGLYSFYIKKIPLLGNLFVSLLTGTVFIYGGLAVNNFSRAILPAFFAVLINVIRELIKDMEDIKGDLSVGMQSFPSKYGVKRTKDFVSFLTVLLMLMTIVPFVFGIYGSLYLLLVLIAVNPILLYFIIKINSKDNSLSLNNLSFILKLNMIFGLIAVYLG